MINQSVLNLRTLTALCEGRKVPIFMKPFLSFSYHWCQRDYYHGDIERDFEHLKKGLVIISLRTIQPLASCSVSTIFKTFDV